MAALTASQLRKTYGGTEVVAGLSFAVDRQTDGLHKSTLELGEMWRPKYFTGAFAVNDDGWLVPVGAGGSLADAKWGTTVSIDGIIVDEIKAAVVPQGHAVDDVRAGHLRARHAAARGARRDAGPADRLHRRGRPGR